MLYLLRSLKHPISIHPCAPKLEKDHPVHSLNLDTAFNL